MYADYKPTRYGGKGFLRNLNIRIHRDITGNRCGLGLCRFLYMQMLLEFDKQKVHVNIIFPN